jgi:hypothetical protein
MIQNQKRQAGTKYYDGIEMPEGCIWVGKDGIAFYDLFGWPVTYFQIERKKEWSRRGVNPNQSTKVS